LKKVKVKPFGVFRVTDDVIESVEKNLDPERIPEKVIKKAISKLKPKDSKHFIAIVPETKELFSFIPIIENDELFASKFPDPIQLYFSLAYSNFQFAKKTRHNITFQKGQGRGMNFVNDYLYNWHLQYKISTIIFLHSTVEAFINYLMPEDFIYRNEYKAKKADKFLKQIKEYNKEQTERYILFKEKLSDVIPQLTKIDFQKNHQKIYDKLLNLNGLRNDIIHLRSKVDKNFQHFHKVFEQVLNVDLFEFVESVKDFINKIKPDFIEIEEVKVEENPTFRFELENHTAFGIDISIFLKILDTPTEVVILNIPKTLKDEKFQSSMNWVMQNLDIMAKQQLIYFPTVNSEFEDRVEIEIRKTDKKLGIDPIWSELRQPLTNDKRNEQK